MPFQNIPGLPGKLYVPRKNPDAPKKHNCPDCFSCQMCSDDRCRICRSGCREDRRPLFSIDAAAVREGGETLFAHTSWRVFPDQRWAVIGPTGSGKSILLDALQRKRPIADGSIRYFFGEDGAGAGDGHSCFSPGQILRVSPGTSACGKTAGAGFHQGRWHSMEAGAWPLVKSFLDPENIGKKSPYEVVPRPREPEQALALRDMLLAELDAEYLLGRRLHHLSNGELRKVLIIQALMRNPKLLIIENPLSGLDEKSRDSMKRILERLSAAAAASILIACASPGEMPGCITHVLYVSGGRVLGRGKKEEVRIPSGLHPAAGFPCERAAESVFCPPSVPGKPDPGSRTLIDMRHVFLRYGETAVLSDICWQMRAGQHWAILGPNGAGKSSLLTLVLADNPQAYANDIRIFGIRRGSGENIWEIKQHMGWVASELQRACPGGFSCLQVVCSGFFDSVGLYREPAGKQLQTAEEWMRALQIRYLAEHRFDAASEGEKRLVLIARALVKNPLLLVLDEPCMGLDPLQRSRIRCLLEALCRSRGVHLIYVSHQPEEIPEAVTHVLQLENGRIAASGRRGDILRDAVRGLAASEKKEG